MLYPPFEYEQTTLHAVVSGEHAGKNSEEHFVAKGKIVKEAGWKTVYDYEEEETEEGLKEQSLPTIEAGDRLPVERAAVTRGKTKPPAHFTEATLLSAMENPVRYMESRDQKAARTLGETGGLERLPRERILLINYFLHF